jgi:hypothetical protein
MERWNSFVSSLKQRSSSSLDRDRFLTLLADGKHEEIYSLFSPALRSRVRFAPLCFFILFFFIFEGVLAPEPADELNTDVSLL